MLVCRYAVTHPHRVRYVHDASHPDKVHRHIHVLIAVVRNLIEVAYPHMTSHGRVAMLWHTHAAMSATFTTRHAVTTAPASHSRIGSGYS